MSTRPLFPQLNHRTRTVRKRQPIRVETPFVITVIGKPGSGKSTLIEFLIGKSHALPRLRIFNDRDVLVQMAHTDGMSHLIRALDARNFEILDEGAYDVAVDKLLETVCDVGGDRVPLIEFSRKDYVRTFQRFPALLAHKKSLVVYLETPFSICKQRNIQRAVLENSYSVPSDEMESYFRVDDIEQLIRKYPKRVMVVGNASEKNDLIHRVDELWSTLKDRIS
jgi:adenylate kinase family enzyme